MQKITVHVGKDGRLKLLFEGVPGPECLAHTEALRAALGETVDLEYTSEYREGLQTETESGTIEAPEKA
jgi:hypothetical protein